MKKALFTMLFMFLGITATFAQKVTVPEPEFADQTYLLTSNSEYVKLPHHVKLVLLRLRQVRLSILQALEK